MLDWPLPPRLRRAGVALLLGLAGLAVAGAPATPARAAPSSAPSSAPRAQDAAFARVDACLQAEMRQKNMPGASMAIAVDGALAHASAFGLRHRDRPERVDTETLFRINSTTKMMGAAGILQQVEQGALDLHAPITDAVPELRFAAPWRAESLSLHTLLSTSAAMPDPYFDYSAMPRRYEMPAWDVDLSGWAAMLRPMHLYAPPGSFWNYSSPNFSLAGLALERATGMPWEDYVVARLFRPAGMAASTFDPAALRASGNFAYGHYQDKIYEPEEYQRPYAYPAGGAYSTPSELVAWALELMDGGGKVLSPASVDAMTTAHVKAEALPWARRAGYGYGVFVEDFRRIDEPSRRVAVYQHPGNGRGQGTELYWVPEQGFAIATLVNRHGTMQGTVDCALRELAGLERTPQPGQGVAPADRGRHAGSYAVQDLFGTRWNARVEQSGGELRVQHPDWQLIPALRELVPEPVVMRHRFFDSFDYRVAGDVLVTFEPGGADPAHSGWLRNQHFVGQRLGELPERLEIEGRGCAELALVSAHATEAPGLRAWGLASPRRIEGEPIAQEDPDDPASSRFRLDLEVEGELGYLSAWIFAESEDRLGMHLLQDQDGDGAFRWPEELVARTSGVGGHLTDQALFVADRDETGPYQLWVHGLQVAGADSRFDLELVAIAGEELRVPAPPASLEVGRAAGFQVCAEPLPGAAEARVGLVEIDFGAPGAIGRVPVFWRPGPAVEPSDGRLLLPWLGRGAG